jgi:hypothetical protein
MISSTACARPVLPLATLHLVSSVMPYCQVTWHCSDARRVVHRLALHCSRTVATCMTVLPAQSC